MKSLIQALKAYFTEDKLRILWWTIGAIVIIIGLFIIGAIFKSLEVILALIFGLVGFCLLVYKIFVGFPSIFGSLTQLLAFCIIALAGGSLFIQWRINEIADVNDVAAAFSQSYSIPIELLKFSLTPLVAGCGLGIGLVLGMLAEITCAVTYRAHTSTKKTVEMTKN